MFTQTAEVIEVIGSRVKVRFSRQSMCSCCPMRFACAPADDIMIVDNEKGIGVCPGDRVKVAIPEGKNIVLSVLTFLLPAVIFICILFLLEKQGAGPALVGGIAAVAVYYIALNVLLKKVFRHSCSIIIGKL